MGLCLVGVALRESCVHFTDAPVIFRRLSNLSHPEIDVPQLSCVIRHVAKLPVICERFLRIRGGTVESQSRVILSRQISDNLSVHAVHILTLCAQLTRGRHIFSGFAPSPIAISGAQLTRGRHISSARTRILISCRISFRCPFILHQLLRLRSRLLQQRDAARIGIYIFRRKCTAVRHPDVRAEHIVPDLLFIQNLSVLDSLNIRKGLRHPGRIHPRASAERSRQRRKCLRLGHLLPVNHRVISGCLRKIRDK